MSNHVSSTLPGASPLQTLAPEILSGNEPRSLSSDGSTDPLDILAVEAILDGEPDSSSPPNQPEEEYQDVDDSVATTIPDNGASPVPEAQDEVPPPTPQVLASEAFHDIGMWAVLEWTEPTGETRYKVISGPGVFKIGSSAKPINHFVINSPHIPPELCTLEAMIEQDDKHPLAVGCLIKKCSPDVILRVNALRGTDYLRVRQGVYEVQGPCSLEFANNISVRLFPSGREMRQAGHLWIGARIGRGGEGTVYRAKEKAGGTLVAIKVIRRNEKAVREVAACQHLRTIPSHPNVVNVRGGNYEHEGRSLTTFYLELCEGSSLGVHLGTGPLLENAVIQPIALGVASGLRHLHEHSLFHGDVKPGNVLASTFDLRSKDLVVKVCDFDHSVKYTKGRKIQGRTGTVTYMAPEMLDGSWWEPQAAEVWSFATMLKVLIGTERSEDKDGKVVLIRPYHDEADEINNLAHLLFPENDLGSLNSFIDFMESMLKRKPDERITFEAILDHNWPTGNAAIPLPLRLGLQD